MHRRRFIQILATSAAGLSLSRAAHARTLQPVSWSGYTMGAEGRFTLYTDQPTRAKAVIKHCMAEIQRLESVFSLYQEQSEIRQLNQNSSLTHASSDWQTILNAVDAANQLTGGLFDPTIQPLWQTYATHFEGTSDPFAGPTEVQLKSTLSQVDWQQVEFGPTQIRFKQAGMQLSLNGIAQGYITDRVADILRDAGYHNVLVELGETRAIGPHPEQRPWNIGIKDAQQTDAFFTVAELNNQALATSGGYGSTFSEDGRFHHLIHPKTGQSNTCWRSLSVIAPSATEADALSTGLSFANEHQIQAVLKQRPDLQVIQQA